MRSASSPSGPFLWLVLLVVQSACGTYQQNEPFQKVRFLDDTGWIFGGESFMTKDGGARWSRIDFHLHSEGPFRHCEDYIAIVDERTIYGLTEGILRKSEDAGRSWRAIHEGLSFERISFRDARHGIGFSLYSNQLHITEDGGASWNDRTQESLRRFQDLCYLQEDLIFACNGTTLMLTEDGGQNWRVVGEAPFAIGALRPFDENLWFTGSSGSVGRYRVKERVFEFFPFPSDDPLYDLFVGEERVYAASRLGRIYVSDQIPPENWRTVQLDTSSVLVSIDRSASGRFVVVGGSDEELLIPPWFPERVAFTSENGRKWERLALPKGL